MLATDMTGSGTPEEKLRWAFRMYDKDNSGETYFIGKCQNNCYKIWIAICRNNRNEGDG